MIKILDFFLNSNKIKSGGANVEKYEIKVYRKTYDKFPNKEYEDINPFGVNNYIHYENECKYLKLLNKYDISPKILETNVNSLLLSDCGEQLTFENCPSDWKKQITNIYRILKEVNIFHNDLKLDNLTVLNNKIYLIDFGWASQNIPSYPYFNLNSEIIDKSDSILELFHHLFNYTSNLVLKMNCNLNNYINCSLRNK
tara:strand:- start:1109 stop:1702 length:594 start_codon:yes stop_codon:yes gene_type:complete